MIDLDDNYDFLIVQTGGEGTIDKDYPKSILGYAFEISFPAAQRILDRVRFIQDRICLKYVTVCQKDSQDISSADFVHEFRDNLVEVCRSSSARRILITHGTDTMIHSASVIAKAQLAKIIVFTGSFLPERFKDSDADFNVGCAWGALQCIPSDGVYVTMSGKVFEWNRVERDSEGRFLLKN